MSVTVTHSSLPLTELGELMRGGDFSPEWLLDNWLYAGRVHWLQGPPGEGKTWLALWFCALLIQQGETVLYLDEENNARLIAERLTLLGCTPEEVEEHFLYVLNPALDTKRQRSSPPRSRSTGHA